MYEYNSRCQKAFYRIRADAVHREEVHHAVQLHHIHSGEVRFDWFLEEIKSDNESECAQNNTHILRKLSHHPLIITLTRHAHESSIKETYRGMEQRGVLRIGFVHHEHVRQLQHRLQLCSEKKGKMTAWGGKTCYCECACVHVCKCMHVYAYVRVYVYIYVYVNVYAHVYVHVHVVCVCVCECARIVVWKYTCMWSVHTECHCKRARESHSTAATAPAVTVPFWSADHFAQCTAPSHAPRSWTNILKKQRIQCKPKWKE